MKSFLLSFLLLLSTGVFSQVGITIPVDEELEKKKANFQLNSKYKAGGYLIYDCNGKFFTCVDQDSFDFCKNQRENSKIRIAEKKSVKYDCAPLKQFSDRKECLLKNYTIIEEVPVDRFCFPK